MRIVDNYDRVTKKTFLDTDNSSQTIAEYKYNNQGSISSIKDNRNNRTKTYMYDLIGRPTSVSGKGGDIDYRYNTCYNTMDAVTKYDNVVDGVHNVTTYGYTSDNLPSSTNNSERQRTYSYDYLGRLSGSTSLAGNWEYTYYEPYANTDTDATHKRWTTNLIETEKIRNTTYKYEYDLSGNITSIYKKEDSESSYTPVAAYAYDSLNRLIQEAMFFVDTDDEIIINGYTYDSRGNVSKKHTTKMKTDLTILLNTDVDVYTYNANWKDLISNYNGSSISYDNAGNPTTYRDGMTMTWKNGRELTTLQKGTTSVSYKYDDESIRTKKTVNGVVHNYEYVGGKLMYEKSGSDKLYFSYDAFGNPYSIKRNSTYYYYDLNWRGDVIALRSKNGSFYCSYKYDAWGKFLGAYNSSGSKITNTNDIALVNPIRYRGYYYDTETGFYYLGSRYYDPQMYRFLNADSFIMVSKSISGINLFSYCESNPIVYDDINGYFRTYSVTMSDSGCNKYEPSRPLSKMDKKVIAAERKYNGSTINVYKAGEGSPRDGKVNVKIDEGAKNIQIENSYKIRDGYEQSAVISYVMSCNLYNEEIFTRSAQSYLSEWSAHNLAFVLSVSSGTMCNIIGKAMGKEDPIGSTISVDLDYDGHQYWYDVVTLGGNVSWYDWF